MDSWNTIVALGARRFFSGVTHCYWTRRPEAPTFKVSPWKNDVSYMASLRRRVFPPFFFPLEISSVFFFLGGNGWYLTWKGPKLSQFWRRESSQTSTDWTPIKEAHGDIAAAAHRKARAPHWVFFLGGGMSLNRKILWKKFGVLLKKSRTTLKDVKLLGLAAWLLPLRHPGASLCWTSLSDAFVWGQDLSWIQAWANFAKRSLWQKVLPGDRPSPENIFRWKGLDGEGEGCSVTPFPFGEDAPFCHLGQIWMDSSPAAKGTDEERKQTLICMYLLVKLWWLAMSMCELLYFCMLLFKTDMNFSFTRPAGSMFHSLSGGWMHQLDFYVSGGSGKSIETVPVMA